MNEFTFAGLVPTKDETLRGYSGLKKESDKLVNLLDGLKSRLDKDKARNEDFFQKEKGLLEQLQRAFAEEKDGKEIKGSLEKLRKEMENGTLEVAGLENLIVEKAQELKDLDKLIKLKDYYVALSNLHPLFDLYNKQAAELAETLKKMFYEMCNCEEEAARSGETLSLPISFVYERGVPANIPAIVRDSSNMPNSEKYHWNYHYFRQENAKAL